MHGIAEATTRVALVAGVLTMANGAATLARHRVTFPWLQGRILWQQHGWAQVLFAVFILVETSPRLADGSATVILVLSAIAVVPLLGAAVLQTRAMLHHSDAQP